MGKNDLVAEVDDLSRRLVGLLEQEATALVQQAERGELDLERLRWLIRCQKEAASLARRHAFHDDTNGDDPLDTLLGQARRLHRHY